MSVILESPLFEISPSSKEDRFGFTFRSECSCFLTPAPRFWTLLRQKWFQCGVERREDLLQFYSLFSFLLRVIFFHSFNIYINPLSRSDFIFLLTPNCTWKATATHDDCVVVGQQWCEAEFFGRLPPLLLAECGAVTIWHGWNSSALNRYKAM